MDQPQALPQRLMQQPDLLLCARLLSMVGQGDHAPFVRGVVPQEGLPLFLKGQRGKKNNYLVPRRQINGLSWYEKSISNTVGTDILITLIN